MNKDRGNLKERALKAVDENIKVVECALHQIKYHRQQMEKEDVSYVPINRLGNICCHLRAMASHINIAEIAGIAARLEMQTERRPSRSEKEQAVRKRFQILHCIDYSPNRQWMVSDLRTYPEAKGLYGEELMHFGSKEEAEGWLEANIDRLYKIIVIDPEE